MTTGALAEDRYVDTCLLRACEAIGAETLSDGAGVAIPIEFDDPPPRTVKMTPAPSILRAGLRAGSVGPALAAAMPLMQGGGLARDDRMLLARVAVIFCAVVAFVATTGAFLRSPLARAVPITLSR